MGLENLKSVFSEGAGTNNSQISGRLTGGGELGPFANHPDEFSQLDFDTNVPTPVDFLTSQVPGFTIRMDSRDKSQFSPDGVSYIQPTKMINLFGEIGRSVDFMNEAQNNPTSISGFDLNFNDKGADLGTSKYIGQFSEFNGGQTLGFNKFQQSVDFFDRKTIKSTVKGTIINNVISGFDMNFNTKGEGDGNSKYIGQTSKFNNNQIVGTVPFTQPSIEKNNKDIFDTNGNFKFNEQDVNYGPLDITDTVDNKSIQFNALYNSNHSAKEFKSIGRGRKLQFESSNEQDRIFTPKIKFGDRGLEPYIVTSIPDGSGDRSFGREFPLERSLTDASRILKFMSSGKGIEFIAKQNLLGLVTKVVTAKKPLGALYGGFKIGSRQRFQSSYNPLSTLGSLVRTLGGQIPNVGLGFLLNREDPFPLDPTRALLPRNYSDSIARRPLTLDFGTSQQEEFYSNFTGTDIVEILTDNTNSLFVPKDLPKAGDKMTLSNMIKGDALYSIPEVPTTAISLTEITDLDGATQIAETSIEDEKAGLPFYFKDLRDNAYVFFRGYLSGITENVSPSWASENYIGRSEPVYIYERAERDISFTLKIVATTNNELRAIYKKLNRLTSMCYPEYKEDTFTAKSKEVAGVSIPIVGSGKIRMKPPLVKFRLGDIYGSANNELTGFIKSISYTVPDNSVWETKRGKKVPKMIDASIGYQVIHGSVPELKENQFGLEKDYGFYGYDGFFN